MNILKITSPIKYLKSKGIDVELDLKTSSDKSYKLISSGFMDLTVEAFHSGKNIDVSMCHYGKQNGELMKDPDILFEYDSKNQTIKYKEYQNDYVGVYDEHERNPNFQKEIESFMQTWIDNLIDQGHELKEI